MVPIVGALFLAFFFTPLFMEEKISDEFPVLSYRSLEVKEFNMQITSAEKKKVWVFNPLSIVMRFHNVSDVRFVSINQKSDRTECPLKSVVTIVEEGFPDDMRGIWIDFLLERKECAEAWRIKEGGERHIYAEERTQRKYS
jgi:hypothetical protein